MQPLSLGRLRFTNVLLLSLDWCRPKDPPISLGAASILTQLQKGGVAATALQYNVNDPKFDSDAVVNCVFAQKPNRRTLLGIGAFVWNEPYLQRILSLLRQYRFPGAILLGGPQISYTTCNPTVHYPTVDVFCRGYAEQAVHKLVTKATFDDPHPTIGGIVYNGLPDLGLQATCQLESLPSPYLEGTIPAQKFLRWETQRGCPFRCSFCQHRESDLATSAAKFRTRRPFNTTRIFEEVKWFCQKKVSDIAVLDPTFNSGPNYLLALDAFIQYGYQGKLALQCRFEMVRDEFLDRVAQLNAQGAQTVLEFGLQTVISREAKAIQRPNRIKKVEEVITRLKELNILFEVSLIFGLPLQTLKSFKQSVNFCLDHEVPVVRAWPLMILRGTPMDTDQVRKVYQLKEKSISASEEIDRVQVNIPHVVESSTFTYSDWVQMAEVAKILAQTEGHHPPAV